MAYIFLIKGYGSSISFNLNDNSSAIFKTNLVDFNIKANYFAIFKIER